MENVFHLVFLVVPSSNTSFRGEYLRQRDSYVLLLNMRRQEELLSFETAQPGYGKCWGTFFSCFQNLQISIYNQSTYCKYTALPFLCQLQNFIPSLIMQSTLGIPIVINQALNYLLSTGVDNNETLKVFRSGGADPDGNQPGDLYVTIKVILLVSSICYHVTFECY